VAAFDGALARAEIDAIHEHLRACERCRDAMRALSEFEMIADAALLDAAPDPELDDRMLDALRSAVAPRASRRLWGWGLAAALLIGAWVGFANWPSPSKPFEVAMARRPAPAQRSGSHELVNFEVVTTKPSYVSIVAERAGGFAVVFPDPNPFVGTLGITMPLEPGSFRIPRDPALDFEVDPADPVARWIVVPSDEPIQSNAWRELFESARTRSTRVAFGARYPGSVVIDAAQ
jgi:hypothetical protein